MTKNKVGRPKKAESEKLLAVNIRLTPSEKADLKAIAKYDGGVSITTVIKQYIAARIREIKTQ